MVHDPAFTRRSEDPVGRPTVGSRVKRILNTRLLLGTVVFFAVLVRGVYFWHLYRVKQTADVYLDKAKDLEAKEDWGNAVLELRSYLQLHPDDVDVQVRLAETYDHPPRDRQTAVTFYYDALRMLASGKTRSADKPGEESAELRLRRRVSELLLEKEEYQSAIDETDKIDPEKRNAKAMRVRALATYRGYLNSTLPQTDKRAIGAGLEAAFAMNQDDVEIATALAELYRSGQTDLLSEKTHKLLPAEQQKAADWLAKRADDQMDQFVKAADDKPSAYLNRYFYRSRYGLAKAEEDLDQARQLVKKHIEAVKAAEPDAQTQASKQSKKPDTLSEKEINVLLASADYARASAMTRRGSDLTRRCREARAEFEQVLDFKSTPQQTKSVYRGVSDCWVIEGNFEEAAKALRTGLATCGGQDVDLNVRLAEVLIQQGKPENLEEADTILKGVADTIARLCQRENANISALFEYSSRLDLIRAEWHLRRGERKEAESLLRLVAEGRKGSNVAQSNAYRAWAALAKFYQDSVDPADAEKAKKANEEASLLKPQSKNSAERRYVEALTLLVGFRTLPPAKRDWKAFDAAIAEAKERNRETPMEKPWRIAILEAESCLRRNDEPAQRQEGIKQALQRVKTAEADAKDSAEGLVEVAQAYEQLGSRDDADRTLEKLEKALAGTPDAYLVRAKVCMGRSDAIGAEKAARQALALDKASEPALAMLVGILIAQDGQKRWDEAIDLLVKGDGADAAAGSRRRYAARLLMRRGGDSRIKAKELIEKSIAGAKNPAIEDRMLLAQIHEAVGDMAAARKEYAAIVDRKDVKQEQQFASIVAYVTFLLRHNATAEAKDLNDLLKRLEELRPDSVSPVELHVRCLDAQKRSKEIEPYLEKAAIRLLGRLRSDAPNGKLAPPAEAQFCAVIGELYSLVDLPVAAKAWYENALKLDPNQYAAAAVFLARARNLSQAITLCIDAAKGDPSARPAITLATILAGGSSGPRDAERVEPLLAKAVAEHKDNVELLNAIANLRITGDRQEDACQLYRRVLELEPKNILALNNLSGLLAEQAGKADEAVKYADRAIELSGPQPGLLDTKGTALLYAGKLEDARRLFEEAVKSPNPDPRYHLHLAAACLRLGKMDDARKSLEKARQGKVTQQTLTVGDRKLLAEVEAKMR
jgi:tetratricopeptide (TPR) repeat protein